MNAKVTMVKLSQLMAASSNKSQKESEEFLRVLFQQIALGLEAGESVKVRGFGTFKLTRVETRKSVDVTTGEENEIPAHHRIVFVPSKELAAAVNRPFEMFETVVLDENVLEEELAQAEIEGNQILATTIEERIMEDEKKMDELKAEEEKSEEAAQSAESEPSDQSEKTEQSEQLEDSERPEQSVKSEQSDATETIGEVSYEIDDPEKIDDKRKVGITWWGYMIIAIVVIAIGIGGLWWLNEDFRNWTSSWHTTENNSSSPAVISEISDGDAASAAENEAEVASGSDGVVEDIPTEEVMPKVQEDKEDVVPTKASDQKVYDTVTDTRYLSTIAKEHYGNYNLWPYIYKENEKILGHPNRIRPGTKVVIPDLSKYGIDPKNKADIEKAKKMGVEIYKRYE